MNKEYTIDNEERAEIVSIKTISKKVEVFDEFLLFAYKENKNKKEDILSIHMKTDIENVKIAHKALSDFISDYYLKKIEEMEQK